MIDDDKIFNETIKVLIEQIGWQNHIRIHTDIFLEAKHIIPKLRMKYQIIFLDIDMPDMDGITIAEKLNQLKGSNELPLIVFITSKDHLVFEALKQFPYSFIRKSHMKEEIEKCIVKIYNKLKYDEKNQYGIKVGRNTILVNLNDIMFLEKENNYVNFHTEEHMYKERTGMNQKEEELRKKNFVRVHLGYMVNMIHISEIAKSVVILDDGTEVPLGKKYRSAVQNAYFEWMVKHNA